ncbi:pyridoxal-5'-phosphate-dependent enzyme family protein [Artemisia annua]|uniref:Pyridoxal-5'-phosphate-dependent enzyme family protein n=1 Tax=Artemisia annua TaxID=35608 RepID=A0A2U1LF99_ARTAN|nr:pyridoxal-5'-phosphate-dependent enzyme family protein [Artemisia annua]
MKSGFLGVGGRGEKDNNKDNTSLADQSREKIQLEQVNVTTNDVTIMDGNGDLNVHLSTSLADQNSLEAASTSTNDKATKVDSPTSFANVINATSMVPKVNFRILVNEHRVDNSDTMLPMAAMKKDAASELIREWIENLETGYYLSENKEKKQGSEQWRSGVGCQTCRPVACVGSGRNALGEVGVYHGAMCYLLQDEDSQIARTQSVASGLKFPGVSPELSFLRDASIVKCYIVTDQEAIDAYKRLCCLEGIIPALEASHALAYQEKLCPTLPHDTKFV